jgi:hypothetical protein
MMTTFVLKFHLDSEDNNLAELQALYDEGWELEFSSDEIVHKGIVRIFMHLKRDKYGSGG